MMYSLINKYYNNRKNNNMEWSVVLVKLCLTEVSLIYQSVNTDVLLSVN